VSCLILFCLTALPVRAAVLEFALDPGRSRISATAGLNNAVGGADDGTSQSPGSDIAAFTGLLRVEAVGDTIRFLDGSFADAAPYPVPLLPGPGGAAATADYGWIGPVGTAPRVAALRDIRFDFFSDPITHSLSDGGFRNAVRARVTSGRADYTLSTAVHSFDLAGPDPIPGDDDPLGYLTSDGTTQTLTFPFYTTLISRFEPGGAYGDYFIFHGEITATRVVPEPGVGGAVSAGAAAAVLARRRRTP
jgi:hypothetical protein